MANHTPEPWRAGGAKIYGEGEGAFAEFFQNLGVNYSSGVNAARAIACVNACAGINPEAIPMLLHSAARLSKDPANVAAMATLRAALALAENKPKEGE